MHVATTLIMVKSVSIAFRKGYFCQNAQATKYQVAACSHGAFDYCYCCLPIVLAAEGI
jgi:hypothetical protein